MLVLQKKTYSDPRCDPSFDPSLYYQGSSNFSHSNRKLYQGKFEI